MRYFGIICLRDNGSSNTEIVELWAWDIDDAKRRCRAIGYLPVKHCLAFVS